MLITFAVMMWAGGFETIYGTLDYDFDRANSINSIASRFGIRNAIRTTRVLHTLAAAALLALGIWMELNVFYFIGWGVAAILLVYENNLVRSGQPAMVGKAFASSKYISTQLLASLSLPGAAFRRIFPVVVAVVDMTARHSTDAR